MRSYSLTLLSLVIVGAVGCDPKGGDSDTSELSASGTEGTGDATDGVSSTGGDDSATTTASPGSASDPGDPTATATATTGEDPGDPTATATTTTADPSVGTSTMGSTSQGTDTPPDDPVDPVPCEGEAVELDAASLAYTWAQIPPQPENPGDSTGSGGDPMIDPDTLYVRLSSQVATCADPSDGIDCGSNWELSIGIPPQWQVPGLYHLNGPEVFGHVMETGPDEGGNQCWGGGGTINGTLEIISVDDNEVKGRLCHVDVGPLESVASLDGSFAAPRCQ